jgi:phosphate transport system substrate-binding protein
MSHASGLIRLAALAGCFCLQSGCENNGGITSDSPEQGRITIHGAGSTFAAPLYQKWADEYRTVRPDVVFEYAAVGSGEGQKRFVNDAVDFGASDSALTDQQIATVKRGVQIIPVAAGSVVLSYNVPGVPDGLKLPRNVYPGIFLGTIKTWNDPAIAAANHGIMLPDMPIVTVVRLDLSGTTFAFTNHLAAINKTWHDGPGVGTGVQWPADQRLAGNGNVGVAGIVSRTPGTIGYVEFGVANRSHLHMAQLENKVGKFIEPTGDTGLAALMNVKLPANLRASFPDPDGTDSYPIVTYTWLLLYKNYAPERLAAIKGFVEWGLTEGQQYLEPLGYIKLPPKVESMAMEAVSAIP